MDDLIDKLRSALIVTSTTPSWHQSSQSPLKHHDNGSSFRIMSTASSFSTPATPPGPARPRPSTVSGVRSCRAGGGLSPAAVRRLSTPLPPVLPSTMQIQVLREGFQEGERVHSLAGYSPQRLIQCQFARPILHRQARLALFVRSGARAQPRSPREEHTYAFPHRNPGNRQRQACPPCSPPRPPAPSTPTRYASISAVH
jgi:hypothetical protein